METSGSTTGFEDNSKFSKVEKFLLTPKLWLLPIIAWFGLVSWSAHHSITSINEYSHQVARESAKNMFNLIVLTRSWNARHGGIYVPVTQETQPNPYLDTPKRDLISSDKQHFTLINPAFMTRQISELAEQFNSTIFHITSLKPIRPANKADSWEQSTLEKFEEIGLKDIGERISQGTSETYRYMAPLITKEPCMKCHARQGYQIGDIRGGISVTLQAEPIFGNNISRIIYTMLQHVVVFMLVSPLLLFFLTQMRRQWLAMKQIREDQQEIIKDRTRSLGNSHLKLERNEARLRAIVESAADGIITINENGIIESFNQAAEQIFGQKRDDVEGGPVTVIIPEDLRQSHLEGFIRYHKTNKSHIIGKRVEIKGLHASGRQPDLELSIMEVLAGGQRCFTALVRDITEKKGSSG
jgi:PAS domain S-box-containing protein